MSKTVSYELPDEIHRVLERMAARSPSTVDELALEWLARHVMRSCPEVSTEEKQAAWERLRQFAGAVESGICRSADNERIDTELAQEYADTHEDLE